jgi:hypothetical protein
VEEGAGDFVRRPRREALRRSAAEARQGVQMEVSTEAGCRPCRVGGGGGCCRRWRWKPCAACALPDLVCVEPWSRIEWRRQGSELGFGLDSSLYSMVTRSEPWIC